MYLVEKTEQFDRWFRKLKDIRAKANILLRIKKIELGNLGDNKSLRAGLYELRFTLGPGYRIYFTKNVNKIILLISGGDKSSQKKDIVRARLILKEIRESNEK